MKWQTRPSNAVCFTRDILIFSCLQSAEYPVAIQPNAKGMFPEGHARFIGERRVYELDLLSTQSMC